MIHQENKLAYAVSIMQGGGSMSWEQLLILAGLFFIAAFVRDAARSLARIERILEDRQSDRQTGED